MLLPVLIGPADASAVPPSCVNEPQMVSLPAGVTSVSPTGACIDIDGDSIAIEITDPPDFGTLLPPGTIPIEEQRRYTSNADAEGKTDVIRYRAVAAGEVSNEVTVEVHIGPANRPPVCTDVAISTPAGNPITAPSPQCVDANGDPFEVRIVTGPAHGVFDRDAGVYTAAADFAGQDSMSFQAIDSWGAQSALGLITITVTDVTAPSLGLLAPSALTLRTALRRGVRFTATTNEAGRLRARAFISRGTARRLKIDRHATSRVVVGSLARDVVAGDTVVEIKLARRARIRMKDASQVKLRIVAEVKDSAQNVGTETVRITLKRTVSD